jgi:hypothetical protein
MSPKISEREILFPVMEVPLFYRANSQSLFPENNQINNLMPRSFVPVDGKKALINAITGEVLSVVNNDYRLVTNQEAINLALQCCQEIFPDTESSDWKILKVNAPHTKTYCFIDFYNKSDYLNFEITPTQEKPDIYMPFVRVINSYNKRYQLTFLIGFCRQVCSNGLILPHSAVKFNFKHSKRIINDAISFTSSSDMIAPLTNQFKSLVSVLLNYRIASNYFFPLITGALKILPPKKETDKKSFSEDRDWDNLTSTINELKTHYIHDLGENAYAVFNCLTDLASNPPDNKILRRDHHSFQRLAGEWAKNFTDICLLSSFSLDNYLLNLAKDNNTNDEQQPWPKVLRGRKLT